VQKKLTEEILSKKLNVSEQDMYGNGQIIPGTGSFQLLLLI